MLFVRKDKIEKIYFENATAQDLKKNINIRIKNFETINTSFSKFLMPQDVWDLGLQI